MLRVPVFNWISSGTLAVDWALRVDTLTAVMLVVVTTVSAVVHVYSIGYMAHDPYRPRFFAYLSMFTFAMLMLVTSDNLVQLFFGWEGVGLASYLLIGFWYTRPAANAAAMKAFIVNRVGDFGFSLGIFGVFLLFHSVDYETIFANAASVAGTPMHFLSWNPDALTVLCILLFMGAMGKSAQFLLHTWLPDAMEGPTPVSALIHAATMVTAGVFMVARLSPLFELAPVALTVVTFFGATTAFFAATVGLVQNDIKRVIAYSTCSQLGYMFVALGVGAYRGGDLPPVHPCLLQGAAFPRRGLGDPRGRRRAGHAQDGRPQDAHPAHLLDDDRRHAGAHRLPAHRRLFLQGRHHRGGLRRHQCARRLCLGAHRHRRADDRVLFLAADLHDLPRQGARPGGGDEAHPRVAAGDDVPALCAGRRSAVRRHRLLRHVHRRRRRGLLEGRGRPAITRQRSRSFWIAVLPTVMMLVGVAIAVWFYLVDPRVPRLLARRNDWLYQFLLNKWYFDELYDVLFVRSAKWIGRFLWKKGDGWLIDGFGPDGISARVLDVTARVVRLQSGYLYHYAFAMLIGIAALITWLMFAA